MNLDVMIKDVEKELLTNWEVYLNYHKELQKYAGQELSKFSQEQIDDANRILKGIQDTFQLIYPAFSFALTKHQWADNAIKGYNEFIETIKKNGARPEEEIENADKTVN